MNNKAKQTIAFIADVKYWAFDNIAQYLKTILEDDYIVCIFYTEEYPNVESFLNKLLERDDIDFIHFFYRAYLKQIIEYFANNKMPRTKFLSLPITTSIPEHLFIETEAQISSYQATLQFSDYYYTISRNLYNIYSKIKTYPKPYKEVIFDNILRISNLPNFKNNDKLVIAWIGNSSWGKFQVQSNHDSKGFHTIIKPTLLKLEREINITSYIVDKKKKQRTKEEVFEILHKTDILLIAANTDGTPLPLIEAMSMGCAVITTYNGIAPEILPDMQQEFIIQPNLESFSNAIKKLNLDRALLTQLKHANYKAFNAIFLNHELFKKKWITLINATMKKAQGKNRIIEKENIINNIKLRSIDKVIFMINHSPKLKSIVKYLLNFKIIQMLLYSLILPLLQRARLNCNSSNNIDKSNSRNESKN
ncbi:MAG: glycosyltransferase [Rickettsiaceae bacterium]